MIRLAALALLLLTPPAAAQVQLELAPPATRGAPDAGPATVEVDVELALMVDVSRSMSAGEMEIQRRGYAEALASPEVIRAIRSGLLGRVAVSYVEWAGAGSQRVILGWQLLETPGDARAFSAALANAPGRSLSRTSIARAITHAAASIDGNGYDGIRRVIDISGDGPNNQGGLVTEARDRAIARGIVINGLPLMTTEGAGMRWHLGDLDLYYRDCVVGGPGSFVIPVTEWSEFAEAVRRKIVLELAGLTPSPARVIPVQTRPSSDCRIGEKIWERNRRVWGLP